MATPSQPKVYKPKTWPLGYVAGTAVIVLGGIVMGLIDTSGAIGYMLIALGLLVYIVCGLMLPKGVKNNPNLAGFGTFFVGLAVLMAIDIFDELIRPATVGNGFSSGNGLLMDGLGTIVYVLAGPLCAIIGLMLLMINSIKKERQSR